MSLCAETTIVFFRLFLPGAAPPPAPPAPPPACDETLRPLPRPPSPRVPARAIVLKPLSDTPEEEEELLALLALPPPAAAEAERADADRAAAEENMFDRLGIVAPWEGVAGTGAASVELPPLREAKSAAAAAGESTEGKAPDARARDGAAAAQEEDAEAGTAVACVVSCCAWLAAAAAAACWL